MRKTMKNELNILDVTLRDGGYANNYMFSIYDVNSIVNGLEESNIEWIEIGHGYGIGAERSFGKMKNTDYEYANHTRKIHNATKIGMFANAGIATKEDIDKVSEAGLDFLRIGFLGFEGPHPIDEAVQLITESKTKNMWTSANIVRSQMYDEQSLLQAARMLEDAGADCIYVVDSTGGMLPTETFQYVSLLVRNVNCNVGFHGHENYSLGVANTLSAIEAGAKYVDGSLLGIGRDAGNTQIEILVSILQKMKLIESIDIDRLCETAAKYVKKYYEFRPIIDTEKLALAQYNLLGHGLPIVKNIASEYKLDWRHLASEYDQSGVRFETNESIESMAKSICGE